MGRSEAHRIKEGDQHTQCKTGREEYCCNNIPLFRKVYGQFLAQVNVHRINCNCKSNTFTDLPFPTRQGYISVRVVQQLNVFCKGERDMKVLSDIPETSGMAGIFTPEY